MCAILDLYLPLSSTSGGAVPAFLASSSSFCFFQSSLLIFLSSLSPLGASVDVDAILITQVGPPAQQQPQKQELEKGLLQYGH